MASEFDSALARLNFIGSDFASEKDVKLVSNRVFAVACEFEQASMAIASGQDGNGQNSSDVESLSNACEIIDNALKGGLVRPSSSIDGGSCYDFRLNCIEGGGRQFPILFPMCHNATSVTIKLV